MASCGSALSAARSHSVRASATGFLPSSEEASESGGGRAIREPCGRGSRARATGVEGRTREWLPLSDRGVVHPHLLAGRAPGHDRPTRRRHRHGPAGRPRHPLILQDAPSRAVSLARRSPRRASGVARPRRLRAQDVGASARLPGVPGGCPTSDIAAPEPHIDVAATLFKQDLRCTCQTGHRLSAPDLNPRPADQYLKSHRPHAALDLHSWAAFALGRCAYRHQNGEFLVTGFKTEGPDLCICTGQGLHFVAGAGFEPATSGL